MAANRVDSSMHNQPCAFMLFTAFYNDLPRRATTIAGRAPTSKVPRNSPHSAYTEPDAIDRTSWLWLNARPPEMCECPIVASAPVRKFVIQSARPQVTQRTAYFHAAGLVLRVTELGSANKATAALNAAVGRWQTTLCFLRGFATDFFNTGTHNTRGCCSLTLG